jgi:hypothetical protein
MKRQPRRNHDEQQPIHSRSYILRLWCAGEPQAGNWHASLEDPSTQERFGFSSLEELFAFLMEQSERDSGTGPGPQRSNSIRKEQFDA